MNSNYFALILHHLSLHTGKEVAAAIGHSESHITRFKTGDAQLKIDELQPFFEAIGLKLIPCDGELVSISKDKYDALKLLAMEGLSK
jgi:hypothetical protein